MNKTSPKVWKGKRYERIGRCIDREGDMTQRPMSNSKSSCSPELYSSTHLVHSPLFQPPLSLFSSHSGLWDLLLAKRPLRAPQVNPSMATGAAAALKRLISLQAPFFRELSGSSVWSDLWRRIGRRPGSRDKAALFDPQHTACWPRELRSWDKTCSRLGRGAGAYSAAGALGGETLAPLLAVCSLPFQLTRGEVRTLSSNDNPLSLNRGNSQEKRRPQ